MYAHATLMNFSRGKKGSEFRKVTTSEMDVAASKGLAASDAPQGAYGEVLNPGLAAKMEPSILSS